MGSRFIRDPIILGIPVYCAERSYSKGYSYYVSVYGNVTQMLYNKNT